MIPLNYLVYGLCSSPNILKEHIVSETGCVPVLRWKIGAASTQFGPSLDCPAINMSLSNGPKWVGASTPSYLRTETCGFWNIVFFHGIRQWTKHSNSVNPSVIDHRPNSSELKCDSCTNIFYFPLIWTGLSLVLMKLYNVNCRFGSTVVLNLYLDIFV
jgi:hypothetical protein